MDFHVDNEDLNGECLVGNPEGEALVKNGETDVPFPYGSPAAQANAIGTRVAFNLAQATAFITAQLSALRVANGALTVRDACVVAYLRFLAARQGLISPNFVANTHNVDYNDAIGLGEGANIEQGMGDWTSDMVRNVLTGQFKKQLRSQFADLVCMVAYMFRVRGHHFLDDMDARYEALFVRCLRKIEEKPAAWKLVARNAFHAIMPDVLDNFWKHCVEHSFCSGALMKRFDSAPAGASGVLALQKGVTDISLVLPGAFRIVQEQVGELDNIVKQCRDNRWGMSVNHRYYGVPRIRVDEAAIGVLASVTMGVYNQLAPGAELKNAPSLQRLAKLAPVTGGAIGRMAVATVQAGNQLVSGEG